MIYSFLLIGQSNAAALKEFGKRYYKEFKAIDNSNWV